MIAAARTREERDAVTAYLRSSGGPWTSPPSYTTFCREDLSKKLLQVRDAVLSETDATSSEVESAYTQTQYFVDSSFDFYQGEKGLGERIRRAFVVPMRSTRADRDTVEDGSGYASESTPFFPLLDPARFGVGSEIRMRAICGLPPTVLDTYLRSGDARETGALVLAPLYADMTGDIWPDPTNAAQSACLVSSVDEILRRTAYFAHIRLGADFIGLGATLPLLTDFGNKLKTAEGMQNLTTTTGHGGTVYMLAKTALEVMRRSGVDSAGRIGIIGAAGSIGWASLQTLHKMLPRYTFDVFDARDGRMRELLATHPDVADSVCVRASAGEVFANAHYVVCAITGQLDLTTPEFGDIDFTMKRVIDDSQPGAVDRVQIERLGGKVFWVAGKDASATGFMTRDGYYTNGVPYNYGCRSGLYGSATEFACGLEAAVVAASGSTQFAVASRVDYSDVAAIGSLFEQYGVTVPELQSFGHPVEL